MSLTRALITGIAGFCGQHLAMQLGATGAQVTGVDLHPNNITTSLCYQADITDEAQLRSILLQAQPEAIFHLAALTTPQAPYAELHRINALGTLALLNATQRVCPESVILIAGSSAAYGKTETAELPIRESQPFRPLTAYAVSKIAQEMLGYQHYAAQGARVICTRTFNLTGPGESENFVSSAFARQIAEIEAGKREPVIRVGNLEAIRDFTDVRDAMRAYILLAEQGLPGEVYNVCSGQGARVRQVLELLLELSTCANIEVQIDPARLQPADVPIQIGSAEQHHALTGWTPTITLRETLRDVLNSWRQRVHKAGSGYELAR